MYAFLSRNSKINPSFWLMKINVFYYVTNFPIRRTWFATQFKYRLMFSTSCSIIINYCHVVLSFIILSSKRRFYTLYRAHVNLHCSAISDGPSLSIVT